MKIRPWMQFCLLGVLALGGCKEKRPSPASSAAPVPASTAAAVKTLHYCIGDEPQDLDPQTVSGTVEHKLFLALFEGLVTPNPQGDTPLPGLAERWTVSDDRLTYTFHLRKNAFWSNGEPVTAQDFVRSYERILAPSLAAEYAYILYILEGAQDYNRGLLKDFSAVGVKAVDPFTLALRVRHPAPFFVHLLQHYAWYPVHLPTVEKFGGRFQRGSAWTRPQNFVGNGPFRLREWLPNQKIIVQRSPNYWDKTNVPLDEVHFHCVVSMDAEERMFRAGQLHVTLQVPLTKLAVYQRERPEVLRVDPWAGTYFYRFNTKRHPLNDARVRRALALAVDRDSLVRNVTLAGEKPAPSLVPPDFAGYTSRHGIRSDVTAAQRLLAEAGYPGGKGFPRIEVNYNTMEKHRIIAEALQQMWRKHLGIDVTLVNEEWRVYMATQAAINFDVQRGGWIADYVDPHAFLEVFQTGGGNNHTHWGNAEYDRLLSESLAAPTNVARHEIYQRMEEILLEECPILPLFYYNYTRLVDTRVLHYRTTYLDDFPFKFVDLKN